MKKILSVLLSKNTTRKMENAAIQVKQKVAPTVFSSEIRGEFGSFSSIFW